MSKHKKRDRDRVVEKSQFGFNMNNNPFGIDPTQLMSLLGNMDIGRMNTMLNTMNKNGFDINSANNMINNNFENINNRSNQNNNNTINNMSELNSLKNGKFDINTINTLAERMGALEKIGVNNNEKNYSDKEKESKFKIDINTDEESDDNLQLLISIRNIVDSNKKAFITRIIEKYKDGDFE